MRKRRKRRKTNNIENEINLEGEIKRMLKQEAKVNIDLKVKEKFGRIN
jgi:hypothetical protein